jgi:hypothetical protein
LTKIRKRTREGKSLQMKVVNPLKVQATTNEVDDLRQDFERFLERN